MWPFPAEIKRRAHTHTLFQSRDRVAMLQLSNWHCSASASTQKEPHKTEKPCVSVDNVILSCNVGNLENQANIWEINWEYIMAP